MKESVRAYVVGLILLLPAAAPVGGAETVSEPRLYAGWSRVDITPDRPVALIGQLHKRISQRVRDPLTATALALETRTREGSAEQAILVSCDVLFIRKPVQDRVRDVLKGRLAGFDADKLLLNATHTHTAPGFGDEDFGTLYDVNDPNVMKASEYAEVFVEQVARAAVEAWERRAPARMGWGLGHAVVGMNRRARYFDGSAVMYGSTNQPNFANVEGYEDHGVETLFFWDEKDKLTGTVVNLACTSQETEGLNEVSADFWHDVRVEMGNRVAKDVHVLAQCAAAGDQSPHLLFRSQAEQIMVQRRGLSKRQEIARRIVDTVADVLPLAHKEARTHLTFKHAVTRVDLPGADASVAPFYTTDPIAPVELHVLRLGDLAMATNPFELYLDYGIRMKARSPAVLTMLVQLSCQHCGYLPTEKAVQGGGYSADQYIVGPEGGQVLVNETVRQIQALWE